MWKIKENILNMIMETSRDSYPNEFAAMLRAKEEIIYEIVLLPGTISGRESALYKLFMKPIDFTIVGTVHSHPSGSVRPSGADLQIFSKTGAVHVIVGSPFSMNSWAAYNREGERISVEMI
jgi:proteasome lid subunit RPN8/RPN11